MAGFAPAVKSQAKARIGLYGVGGSGKTMAALLIARGLVPGGRYGLIDCEAGKSSAYADTFPFDTVILPAPYTAPKFRWCIEKAVEGSYDVLIFDGISPFWSGLGGVLAVVDQAKKRGGGWSDGSPVQQEIVGAITTCPLHIIVTMRAKSDTVVEKVDGRTTIRKVGMKYDQRDNLEYDLGWLLYLEHGTHAITVEKTHMIGQEGVTYTPADGSDDQPAEAFGMDIAEWLGSGAAPAPASAPEPAPTPEPAPAAPAPASAPPAQPGGTLTAEQRNEIEHAIAALVALKERDWRTPFLGKIKEWYGVVGFDDLSTENAGQLLERLEATRRATADKIAADAAA